MMSINKRTVIGLVCVLVFVMFGCSESPPSAPGTGYIVDTLYLARDALIDSAVPNGTFGQSDQIGVASITYTGGFQYDKRTLIGLPDLPDSLEPSKVFFADLQLSYIGTDSSRTEPVLSYEVNGIWAEDDVNWINQPDFFAPLFSSDTVANKKLTISVLPFYTDTVTNQSIILAANSVEQFFYSRENFGSVNSPIVIIKQRN